MKKKHETLGSMACGQNAASGSRNPPSQNVLLSELPLSEQRLIKMAHDIGFGTLSNIVVLNGEWQPGTKAKARKTFRPGKPDRGRSTVPLRCNFLLKAQQIELLETIHCIDEGVVSIEIADGLPVRVIVEEEIAI